MNMVELENATYDPNRLSAAVLRIIGLKIPDQQKGAIFLKAYIDFPNADENKPEDIPNFLGKAEKKYDKMEGSQSIFLDIKPHAKNFIRKGVKNTITIVNTLTPFNWEKMNIALYTD